MMHNTYIHQCNDYRQQLQDNKRELKVLEVRCENTKAAEIMQATKVQHKTKGFNVFTQIHGTFMPV